MAALLPRYFEHRERDLVTLQSAVERGDDEEVARILRESDERAYRLLEEHRDDLERVTEALIEREVLTQAELEEIVGKRVIDEEEISKLVEGAL